jgi:hypothetical protein
VPWLEHLIIVLRSDLNPLINGVVVDLHPLVRVLILLNDRGALVLLIFWSHQVWCIIQTLFL